MNTEETKMNRCIKCDNEAQYIVDGNSVCKEHKTETKTEDKSQGTGGDRIAGSY